MTKKPKGPLVWDSELGQVCPQCQAAIASCACPAEDTQPSGDGVVRVALDRKGRGGKVVTVVTGLPLAPDALRKLAKELKQRCGTGGSVKDGNVEIQGDRRDLLIAELAKHGYKAKKSGG